MHEDFYSVATTTVLVFFLGGVFLIHWVTNVLGKNCWWTLLLLTYSLFMPTVATVLISLGVLSGTVRDTGGWHLVIVSLVLLQILGGFAGLYAQTVESWKPQDRQSGEVRTPPDDADLITREVVSQKGSSDP